MQRVILVELLLLFPRHQLLQSAVIDDLGIIELKSR